jgi:hypothetical protein
MATELIFVDNILLEVNPSKFSKRPILLIGLTSRRCKNVVKCCSVIYGQVCGNIFVISVYCIYYCNAKYHHINHNDQAKGCMSLFSLTS